jgi:hypothetical protein
MNNSGLLQEIYCWIDNRNIAVDFDFSWLVQQADVSASVVKFLPERASTALMRVLSAPPNDEPVYRALSVRRRRVVVTARDEAASAFPGAFFPCEGAVRFPVKFGKVQHATEQIRRNSSWPNAILSLR